MNFSLASTKRYLKDPLSLSVMLCALYILFVVNTNNGRQSSNYNHFIIKSNKTLLLVIKHYTGLQQLL